jgi:hypothetical protein
VEEETLAKVSVARRVRLMSVEVRCLMIQPPSFLICAKASREHSRRFNVGWFVVVLILRSDSDGGFAGKDPCVDPVVGIEVELGDLSSGLNGPRKGLVIFLRGRVGEHHDCEALGVVSLSLEMADHVYLNIGSEPSRVCLISSGIPRDQCLS